MSTSPAVVHSFLAYLSLSSERKVGSFSAKMGAAMISISGLSEAQVGGAWGVEGWGEGGGDTVRFAIACVAFKILFLISRKTTPVAGSSLLRTKRSEEQIFRLFSVPTFLISSSKHVKKRSIFPPLTDWFC